MQPIKTFIIGSMPFFNGLEGYNPKDIDELNIMDEFPFRTNIMHMKWFDGKDVFLCRNMDKDGFIEDTIKCDTPMRAGKLLVPEFAEYLGLTIDDLKRIEPVINKIDDKHTYEKIIYDSYVKNGGFYLTDEQRKLAFEDYKKKRAK